MNVRVRNIGYAAILIGVLSACASPRTEETSSSATAASPTASGSVNIEASPTSSPPPSSTVAADPCASERLAVETIAGMTLEERLECFDDRPIVVKGFVSQMVGVGTCAEQYVPGGGWLHLCGGNQRLLVADPEDDEGLTVFLPPEVSPASIPQGVWINIQGHFDDPAAATCAIAGPDGPTPDPAVTKACRTAFVAEQAIIDR